MSIQRNDWSLQRKGIIDQERHKERVKEAIRKNLGSIVSNEAIILSDGKRSVKVPIRSLDEYKFRYDYRKRKHVGQGDGKTRVVGARIVVDRPARQPIAREAGLTLERFDRIQRVMPPRASASH